MLRKMLAVAAIALVAPIAMAQAQLQFGVGAGASIPNGDFADVFETGYHLLVTAGIHPPLSPLGFRVDGSFNEFKAKPAVATLKLRTMALTANGVLSLPGAIVLSPYAIGGVGMYRNKSDQAGDEATNDFGYNIGAGVKFGLAGFGAFGELRWHNMRVDDGLGGKTNLRFIPITFGVMF